ncbi:MAG: hypothetical protein DMG60_07940 [Acidobacteria bacterium]|nr:MAG: hypothetical protein DMG60_07940 [Acidobacteriota bacterium]
MSLHLHEDAQLQSHRVVTIHTAGCKQSRPRKPTGKADPALVQWHGPFPTLDEAQRQLWQLYGIDRA